MVRSSAPRGSTAIGVLLALASGMSAMLCPASIGADTLDSEVGSVPPGGVAYVVTCPPGGAVDLRADLVETGMTIVAHLAADRWLVVGSPDAAGKLPGRASLRPWRARNAIVPALRSVAKRGSGEPAPGIVSVVVALASGDRIGSLRDRLESVGASVSWVDQLASPVPQIGLRVAESRLDRVIDVLETADGLLWADLQPRVRLRNAASARRCQSGSVGNTPVFERGLRGQGQVIGIMDTGLDIDHCRFRDDQVGLPALNPADGTEVDHAHRKVLAVDFHWEHDWPPEVTDWDDQGHGTHVAGSAAGDIGADGLHDGVDGMAPAAKLVIQDGGAWIDDCADLPGLGCPVKPLEPVLEQARNQGARIHTNSWGDEENILPYSRYTERTADVDRFMWHHKDTLVFFAAGNAGPGVDSIGSPATAKNVVAVGATLHGDVEPPCPAVFSSRGWTHDGRIKPDVMAPGSSVWSAASNFLVPRPSCGDVTKSGTSMASPTAAGLAALVRQYFTDGFHPTGTARIGDAFEPTAALVKAVLIASGVDLAALGCSHDPIPSRDQGWGLIQLDTALAFAGDRHRLLVDDHLDGFARPDDDAVRYDLELLDDGPLKVVLVWTDAPSSSLAQTNLLNDLDLGVVGPDGGYRGNAFVGGVSVAGGQPDRLNNVEVVFLPDAAKGVWTIEVSPHAIPVPEQDWALVVVGLVRWAEAPRRPSGRTAP